MAQEQAFGYCEICQRRVQYARHYEEVPHTLYLIVTLFLCGLWVPVWIGHIIYAEMTKGKLWQCQGCGVYTNNQVV